MSGTVTVRLDRKRPYRVNDSDREAIWVGPGEVEVPVWVARNWGMLPLEGDDAPVPETPVDVDEEDGAVEVSEASPIGGQYDDLTAAEVVELMATLSDAEKDAIKMYEAAHKNRVTVMRA